MIFNIKNHIVKAIVVAVVLLLLFLLSLRWCDRWESPESFYPNMEAAIRANAVGESKWIPALFSSLLSITDIREKHNVDTNEIWLSFYFQTRDIRLLLHPCEQIPSSEIRLPRKPISGISWWPRALFKNSKDKIGTKNIYLFYRCVDGGAMAIDIEKGEAFYWYSVEQ